MMERPAAATILGVVNLIFGVWGICGGIANIAFLAAFSAGTFGAASGVSPFAAPAGGAVAALSTVSAAASGLLSILLVAAGVGLLLVRRWGRAFGLAAAYLTLAYFFAIDIAGTLLNAGAARRMVETSMGAELGDGALYFLVAVSILFAAVFHLFYPSLQIYFLTRPEVRRAYGAAG